MTFSFHGLVRMTTEQHHANGPEHEGQRGEQSGLGITDAKALDDGRQEEGHAVTCGIETEIYQRAQENARVRQRLS